MDRASECYGCESPPSSNLFLLKLNLLYKVLWAGLPGTETGNSLADVLFGNMGIFNCQVLSDDKIKGDWNPSGRLPYTIAKNVQDYPAQILAGSSSAYLSIPYTEG
jgi:hypothetical protein